MSWWDSIATGSSLLSEAYVRSDPPAPADLEALRRAAALALEELQPPPVDEAMAVGGTATSLRLLVGAELGPDSLERAIDRIAADPGRRGHGAAGNRSGARAPAAGRHDPAAGGVRPPGPAAAGGAGRPARGRGARARRRRADRDSLTAWPRPLPIPGLNPGTRFADAAAAAVEVRAREVFAHADGVLDTSDIERVHDMRVATRRLRAAMEVFASCFPKSEHKQLLHEVKALADVLGERRDPDVAIAALEKVAAKLTAADRPGIESLVRRDARGSGAGQRPTGRGARGARRVAAGGAPARARRARPGAEPSPRAR